MHSSSVNLVKNKSNFSDELLKWALNFGRLLIIVVEVVALSAFLWRFVLDRKLTDLNDKIQQEQAIIEASRANEAKYRNLQQRLATVKTINTTGNRNYKIINDIIAKTPVEITYNSISIENDLLKLDTNIMSVPALTAFLSILKQYPQVQSVAVANIQNSAKTNAVNTVIEVKFMKGTK